MPPTPIYFLCQLWTDDIYPWFGNNTAGFSLHRDIEAYERFMAEWKRPTVEDVTLRPHGAPYWVATDGVTLTMLEAVVESDLGVHFARRPSPWVASYDLGQSIAS
jgi:hypothetical protein